MTVCSIYQVHLLWLKWNGRIAQVQLGADTQHSVQPPGAFLDHIIPATLNLPAATKPKILDSTKALAPDAPTSRFDNDDNACGKLLKLDSFNILRHCILTENTETS